MDDLTPRLYIIMREDIPDMNPGKGMAQAAHAQSDFNQSIENICGPHSSKSETMWESIRAWKEDRSFGTTLVLSATLADMERIHVELTHSGLTTDPTYPWRNHYGKLFLTEEITCMWAFAQTADELEFMKQYPLHK
jgi:hypothetical protein|tara:strand:- start:523 stop:930 length:408 start_codon:yes stop_codon:yes gene_type:complete